MLYVRIRWIQPEPHDEPVEFYYEIGENGWALRGVEVFAGGSLNAIGHGLKEAPIPSLDDLNLDSQFQGMEISRNEFEVIWGKLSTTSSP